MTEFVFTLDSDHTQPWNLPVGKLILNFGILELLSLMWISDLAADPVVLELANDMTLSKKLALIAKLVGQSALPPGLEQEAKDSWGRVAALSKMRNDLAHGPIMYGWHGDEHAGAPDYIGCVNVKKVSLKDDVVPHSMIEYDALCDAVNETARLCMDLGPMLDRIKESSA